VKILEKTSKGQRVFEIVYRLAHLTELYTRFRAWAQVKGHEQKTLKEFAADLEKQGHPLGDGVQFKTPPTKVSVLVPIDDLYELYQSQPDRPDLTLEEFIDEHDIVCRFRQDTGRREFIDRGGK